jgi:cytochrome b subunit of formate dehydrogenase
LQKPVLSTFELFLIIFFSLSVFLAFLKDVSDFTNINYISDNDVKWALRSSKFFDLDGNPCFIIKGYSQIVVPF